MNSQARWLYIASMALVLTILWMYTLWGYYPPLITIIGSIFCASLPAIAGVRLTLPILIALGPFFGNHPGGRFLEFYDLAILSAAVSQFPFLIQFRQQGNGIRTLAHLSIVIMASYLAAFYLLESFEGYKKGLYHFLSAPDWLPHYSIKVAIANGLCALLSTIWVLQIRRSGGGKIGASFLILAFIFPATVGILESIVPGFATLLDHYHIWMDGYVDRSQFRSQYTTLLAPAIDTPPNSLFWNRSWFSSHLVSTLPIIGLGLYRARIQYLPRHAIAFGLVLIYLAIVIEARAGVLSVMIFLLVLSGASVKRFRSTYIFWGSITALLMATMLIPFLSFLDLGPKVLGARSELYQSGLQIWKSFPLTGAGVESFGFWNDMLLRGDGFQRRLSSSHNFLVQLLSGMGLLGLIYFLFLFKVMFSSLFLALRQGDQQSSGVAAWMLAGWFALISLGSFQELWYLRGVQLSWWLCLLAPGLLWPRENAAPPRFDSWASEPRLARFALVSITLVVVATSVYMGLTISERFLIFENVGHLERVRKDESTQSTAYRYPLLAGEGAFWIREAGKLRKVSFECKESVPSLTGAPDHRKICRYEPVPKELIIENFD
ncbi:MAG: hypothetical protein CMF59_02970 [Leptospiraceae bacterium]|nr:hypothetical protein [Leptospiraceae bacterium]